MEGVKKLLERLGLENKYEDKLTSADFLEISDFSLLNKEPRKENELVHAFMKQLLTGDYTARHVSVKTDTIIPDSQTGAKEGAYAALLKESNVNSSRNHSEIHPMDVQMAVFLCADDFLRQMLVKKLAQCQYAIPLLVPDPFSGKIVFPLWTMRQINKSWTDVSKKIISESVYKAETPMVAFFTLGSVSSSKSQLINNLINEKHNTFFHRNCKGSSRNRLLMDGVVEIAWYCPSGKSSDHFSECIAFCNLHGDSSRAGTQREILTTMTSVNVILLPNINEDNNNMKIVEELCNSETPLIVVLTDEEDGEDAVCKIDKEKYKVKLKGLNQSAVSVLLRDVIKKCLSQNHKTFNLEKMTNNSKLSVDEDSEVCQRCKKYAQNIMDLLNETDALKVKEKHLPCQGKLWHDWCEKSKNLRRLQSDNIENELSNKKTEMEEIRQKQQEHGFSNFMKSFVDFLKPLSENERKYFLSWSEILLDEFVSEKLSDVRQKYYNKWTEVLALKKKHDKAKDQVNLEKFNAEKSNLEKISEELNAANFGLEHIMREMGQIYEAVVSKKEPLKIRRENVDENVSSLPELAAELMISGHPMELMDGDTAYVPLMWVSDVLDKVIKILEDQTVFVLSVLGIQSSGKSTMLNAMFGLQFAVSAGRCTRGAFMQLVKVSEDKKKDLKFDYILVVDTEGLRSSELSGNNIHHDNELSTFVVGLGNMTLINIFGENPTEMQEILQIVVYAFLRMKQVRLNPSCMFVHQNVSDIAAREKIMDGRRHLQETLDKMTRLAAKDEEYYTENFSDVIAFDVERDVKYFAHLWEGSPPMAPPNPCYSENIQELKRDIFSRAENTNGLKLSEFQKRVKDLWKALLDENFVFSFKNALEISVYRKLEQEYGKWTWSLRSAMMSVEEKMLNRVDSGTVQTVYKNDLEKEIAGSLKNIQEEFNKYFKEDPEKETLIQWKVKFEKQILHLHDELITEAKTKVDDSIQQKRFRQKLDEKRVTYEKTLLEQSKELALKLKENSNDKTHASQEFDLMWKKWVSELSEQAPKIKDVNISQDITEVLGEVYKHDLVSSRKRSKEYKIILNLSDYNRYVSNVKSRRKSFSFCFGDILTPEINKSIRDLIIKVTEGIKNTVASFPFSAQGYTSHYIQSMAHDIRKQVIEFEARLKKDRKLSEDVSIFNQQFYVDLSLHVFKQTEEDIKKLHDKYKKANDPVKNFEKKRDEYYNIFLKYLEGASSAAILGDQVCSKLKAAILQSVYNRMAKFLCGQMTEQPPFNGNRADLEKYILKSLAEQKGDNEEDKNKKFNNYLTYMNSPKAHFEGFIKTRVEEFMTAENPKAVSETKETIEQKQSKVINAAIMATDEVKRVNGDVNHWLETFSTSLADELGDTRVHLCEEEYKNSIDFDVLVAAIKKKIPTVSEDLKRNLSKISDFTMEKFRERPDDILIKHFCRCCWEQCPFCGAVCTNNLQDHSELHHAVYHRPSGINGWHYRGTTEFFLNFCTTAVASDKDFFPSSDSKTSVPYKQYRTAGGKYETWSISPDLSEMPYWKWFLCEFKTNLEKHHNKCFTGKGKIPDKWKKFSQSDAVDGLGIQ